MLQPHTFIRCFFINLILFICFPLTPALLLFFISLFFLSLPIAFYLSFLSLAVLFNRYFLLSFNIFPLSSPRSLSPSPSLTPFEFPHALLVPSRLDGTLTLHTGLMLMLDAWRFVQFAASVSRRIYEASVIHEGSSGHFPDAGLIRMSSLEVVLVTVQDFLPDFSPDVISSAEEDPLLPPSLKP